MHMGKSISSPKLSTESIGGWAMACSHHCYKWGACEIHMKNKYPGDVLVWVIDTDCHLGVRAISVSVTEFRDSVNLGGTTNPRIKKGKRPEQRRFLCFLHGNDETATSCS